MNQVHSANAWPIEHDLVRWWMVGVMEGRKHAEGDPGDSSTRRSNCRSCWSVDVNRNLVECVLVENKNSIC
jgi:hypothetical protein